MELRRDATMRRSATNLTKQVALAGVAMVVVPPARAETMPAMNRLSLLLRFALSAVIATLPIEGSARMMFTNAGEMQQWDIDEFAVEKLPPWAGSFSSCANRQFAGANPMICEASYREGDFGRGGTREAGEGGGGSGGRITSKATPASDQNSSVPGCAGTGDGNISSGNPVILATGEKLKTERDIPAFGLYGLGLDRTYRSLDTRAKMFGPKWRSSYDHYSLIYSGCWYDSDYPGVCIPTSVTVVQPDGSTHTYACRGLSSGFPRQELQVHGPARLRGHIGLDADP